MKPKKEILQGDLTQGTVWKVILKFTFPLLIGNILQQTYHLIDSIIVGQFLGKEALAAVSASFFIYYFIISLIIGVGSGITVVVSQYYGAKQYDKVQHTFSSFFICMLISGVLLSIFGFLFAETFFRIIQTPDDVISEVVKYFKIYIIGTFLFITFNSIISILRGIGDTTRPMYFIFIAAILNVIFDLLFIIIFKWDIEGVAWATILAQGIGMCISLTYIHRRHPVLSVRRKDLIFDWKLFVKGLKIGLPTSIQQSSISLGLIALLGIVNSFGTDTLTAYGAAGKIDSLITQAILTSSSALAAFCGQNIGAADFERVRKGVYFCIKINILFCIIALAVIYFFGTHIMKIFTSDLNVIATGYEYLLITGSFFIVHGVLNILNGALRGAGDTFFTMTTSIITLWLIRIPLAYYLSNLWGTAGIWWAINFSIGAGFLIILIYYKTGRWKKRYIIG
jgi:putative MATE family efflux protein